MKLVVRSVVVLAIGCVVALGCYFALGSVPTSALGGLGGGHGDRRGGPPAGFAATQAQPPAGAPAFRGDGDREGGPSGREGRAAFGGREGHGGGFGVLGLLKDAMQITIVTVLVALLGWVVRSRGRRRMDTATDPA